MIMSLWPYPFAFKKMTMNIRNVYFGQGYLNIIFISIWLRHLFYLNVLTTFSVGRIIVQKKTLTFNNPTTTTSTNTNQWIHIHSSLYEFSIILPKTFSNLCINMVTRFTLKISHDSPKSYLNLTVLQAPTMTLEPVFSYQKSYKKLIFSIFRYIKLKKSQYYQR